MFLPAKKTHKISIHSELEHLKDVVEGPFLSAKHKIDVNSEFQFLLKKFEKRLQNQRQKDVSKYLENFDKSESAKGVKQIKIVNVFSVQKASNSKV